jgi:hypothetical protein
LFICSANEGGSGDAKESVSGAANEVASASDASGARPPIGRGRERGRGRGLGAWFRL